MNVFINFRDFECSSDITNWIDRRVSFVFARLQHEIESLYITITDINGPRSGVDKRCKIVLHAGNVNQVVITETRDNVRQAIDRSLARASQSLNRKLKRRKLRLRKTPAIEATAAAVPSL